VGIVVARAIARDICDGPELTRFFSMLMLVNGLAPILAPVLGGQLLRFASWRGIFVALTVVGLLLMLAAVKFHESLPLELRQPDIRGSFKNFAVLLQNRYFLGHCLMQCSFFAAFFAYISGSSFVFQAIYHVSAQVYSGIFGGIGICIAVAGIVPARLAGRVPEVSLLAWALIQAVVGAVLLLICIVLQAPLICVLLSLLVIIPMISVMGASSFSLAMRANGRMAGSASALIGFFSMVSGGIMAPLVGINGPEDALPMGIIVLLGTLGALSVFVVMIWPRHHRGGRLAQS
jgi:DHA1 family bicyclomycin/chloramphenicol resistance-like MFS transporter